MIQEIIVRIESIKDSKKVWNKLTISHFRSGYEYMGLKYEYIFNLINMWWSELPEDTDDMEVYVIDKSEWKRRLNKRE